MQVYTVTKIKVNFFVLVLNNKKHKIPGGVLIDMFVKGKDKMGSMDQTFSINMCMCYFRFLQYLKGIDPL